MKPFGWKGTAADIADFSSEALQVHMGMQSDVLLARGAPDVVGTGTDPGDPDGDGMRDEIRHGPFTALVVHLALLELPIVEPFSPGPAYRAGRAGLARADDDQLRRGFPTRPATVP